MRAGFLLFILIAFASCFRGRPDGYPEESVLDSLQAAESVEKSPAYAIVDNPTKDPVEYLLNTKRRTVSGFTTDTIEVKEGENRLQLFDKNGTTDADTVFTLEAYHYIFLNVSRSKYYVLMKEYQNVLSQPIRTPEEMMMDELTKSSSQQEVVWSPTDTAHDLNKKYHTKKFRRTESTEYFVTTYSYDHIYTEIGKEEIIVPVYWNFGCDKLMGQYENLESTVKADAYLRVLIREKDFEKKIYLNSSSNSYTDIKARLCFPELYNFLVHALQSISVYDGESIQKIGEECADCKVFFEEMKKLEPLVSIQGFNRANNDYCSWPFKSKVDEPWFKCKKNSKLIRKIFSEQHFYSLQWAMNEFEKMRLIYDRSGL